VFEVRVLGEFSVWRDGSLIPLGSRKYYALLAFLALEQGRVLRREQVIALLWEHARTTAARQSLRQAIYALRSRLRGLPLQATREEVWLPAGAVAVDALEFRSAVFAGRWEDAVALYRGGFLDGFWLRDSPAFQEWQEGLQRNLASLARRAFHEVLKSAEARGDWARAMDVADRLLGLDPYDEAAHRAKLQAIAASGDTARARIEFERLKSMLRAELDRDPEPETLRLVEGILAGDPELDAPEEASEVERVLTPFHGREEEFRWLRETWFTVRSEGARIALVLGEAGIGKTRFCRHFLRYAAIRGARILTGRCFPSETRLAYAGVVDALLTGVRSEDLRQLRPPWSDVVLELLPELDPHGGASSDRISPGGEGSSRRLFEGVARLLEVMSQGRELVLFIDDFQWADASTVALVHYLNRRLTASPVLVLLAIRPEDMPPDSPARLIAGPASKVERLVSIRLGLLSDQATAAIIESFATKQAVQLSPALRAALLDSTAGHPFFLLETLKAIGNGEIGEAPAAEAGEGGVPRLSLPASVGEFLAARFATLSADALEVMRALAVFGREANLDLLRATTGQPTPEFIRGIEELIARGLVQEAEDAVRFIHDLVREAAYRRMTGARRRSFHERAAIALENMPQARPGQIAWHYNVAGNRSRAYRFALLAAEESERLYAHAEADYFLRLALSNAETDAERVACQTKLAALLYRLRRFDEAEAVFSELEQYAGATLDGRLLLSAELNKLMIQAKRGAVAANDLVNRLQVLATQAEASGWREQTVVVLRFLADAAHDAGRFDVVESVIPKLLSLGRSREIGLPGLRALECLSKPPLEEAQADEGTAE